MMVIIKNNQYPEGKELPPDLSKYDEPPPCKTRQMTEEEREKYGPPNLVRNRRISILIRHSVKRILLLPNQRKKGKINNHTYKGEIPQTKE